MRKQICCSLLFVLLSLPFAAVHGAEKPRKRQATGTLLAVNPSKLSLSKRFGRNQATWNFTVSPGTSLPSGAAKGSRVTIYYHEEKSQRIADRVKVVEAAPAIENKPGA